MATGGATGGATGNGTGNGMGGSASGSAVDTSTNGNAGGGGVGVGDDPGDSLSGAGLDAAVLGVLLDSHRRERMPRLDLLWSYFRNELEPRGRGLSPRGYRVGQEAGLPARITGGEPTGHPGLDGGLHGDLHGGLGGEAGPRREVVIENDIAWRVQTMVDFMFGRPIRIESTAAEPSVRDRVERVLDAVWEASGGIGLLQDMALLGNVFGWVDLAVRLDERALAAGGREIEAALSGGDPAALRELVRIEVIEPRRGVPVVSEGDYRSLDGYAIRVEHEVNEVERDQRPAGSRGRVSRLFGRAGASGGGDDQGSASRKRVETLEVLGKGVRLVFRDGALALRERSALLPGVVPVVHVQNVSQPFRYEGLGEVEPLIPLQDELNTRLSDRASRVTMQSFRMWLAKGLEGFAQSPVGPGQVWSTDNPEASIESFGGDASSPSESEHVGEIREAMDKVSGVPPVAAGVVRAKIGNLSSANALRVTLTGVLSRTSRKRVSYGRGIVEASRLVLAALDRAGAVRTGPADRGLTVRWPEPLPESDRDRAETAAASKRAGVSEQRALEALGLGENGPGIE